MRAISMNYNMFIISRRMCVDQQPQKLCKQISIVMFAFHFNNTDVRCERKFIINCTV